MDQKLISLLLDCLHCNPNRLRLDDLTELSEAEWEVLLTLAARQRVQALLYQNLRNRGLGDNIPKPMHQKLKGCFLWTSAKNLRFTGELIQIASTCKAEGIPLVVMKGMYLAHTVYGNIGLREMNDIDLLVHEANLAQVAEIMLESNYSPLTRISLDRAEISKSYHLPRFIKKNVAGVEIHWSVDRPERSPLFNVMDLWNRAKPIEIAQTEMLSLCPEDVLLYLCAHNAHHVFGFGLRPYCDILATINHFSSVLDWGLFLERAQRWGWDRGVYLSLKLARDFIGAEIPENILENLKPPHDTRTVYSIARSQTFESSASLQKVNLNIAIYTHLSLWQRTRMLIQRFFPSRLEIASKYNVAPNSWAVWLKYPVRWKDLFAKHSNIVINAPGQDVKLAELAERKGELVHWLSGSQ